MTRDHRAGDALSRNAIGLLLCLLLLSLGSVGRFGDGPAAAAREPGLTDVLDRLSAYLMAYEDQLATLVAEEEYVQCMGDGDAGTPAIRRSLTSDVGFLRLPGRQEWLGLRDTFLLDGVPVRDREVRLERLLTAAGARDRAGLADAARRIVEDNARYNLGDLERTINVPTFALDLLHPRHRWRFRFRRRGEDRVEGRAVWTVDFTERERPTLVRTPQGRSRPVRGTAWIDPVDGAVLRTEMTLEGDDNDGAAGRLRGATVTVSFRREPALGLLLPVEMHERYDTGTRDELAEIRAVAAYTNYRQFRATARLVPRP
jgi:hypothetical protein